MSSSTQSASYSYTDIDVEKVIRRFSADLIMIASSSRAITEDKAREYSHDVELLAKSGYLKSVDVTLLKNSVEEVRAVRYDVITGTGDLGNARPGGVLWPQVENPYLRIVLWYTDAYTAERKEQFRSKLNISWSPTSADTSHATLAAAKGNDYSSNGFGMSRQDYQ